MESPFKYGKTVTGQSFTDREAVYPGCVQPDGEGCLRRISIEDCRVNEEPSVLCAAAESHRLD